MQHGSAAEIAADLRWFLDRLDDPPPLKMHRPGIWADDDGLGSLLGSPAWDRGFARWIEGSPSSTVVPRAGEPCPVCGESACCKASHIEYRRPLRAAIAGLRRRRPPVPVGLPEIADVLSALANARGNPQAAAETLSRRWPAMADDATAGRMFGRALRLVRDAWREGPTVMPRRLPAGEAA